MKKLFLALVLTAAVALAAFGTPSARAQGTDNLTAVVTITNTARVPGTLSVIAPRNTKGSGVWCTLYQSAEVGATSTVLRVSVEDATSGVWRTLGSTAALDSSISSTDPFVNIMVYPGAVATSVPTNTVVVGLKVPAIWRITQVITGGTSTTGSASCGLLN